MTQSIFPLQAYGSGASAYSTAESESSTAVERSSVRESAIGTPLDIGDIASISEEARVKYSLKQEEPEETEFGEKAKEWLDRLGLESGTQSLKDGVTREVEVEDGEFTVNEYKEGRLVRTINGSVSDRGVSMTTKLYDATGEVRQTSTVEMSENEDEVASVRRSFQWFEHGELTRSMTDSMLLRSEYIDLGDMGTEGAKVSQDQHVSTYHGSIQEYTDGQLRRSIEINRESTNVSKANRSDVPTDDLAAWSMEQVGADSLFSIEIVEFDADGEKVRDSLFEDHVKDFEGTEDGELEQSFSSSWYANGKLVQRTHGELSMSETELSALPERPNILDLLNLSEEEYVTEETKSGAELLSDSILESSSDASFFTDALQKYVGKGQFDTAENISEGRASDRPYSVRWETEIYNSEGELTLRRKDTEEGVENLHEGGLEFRIGGALAEDEYRATLDRTSHVVENYDENGKLRQRSEVRSKESIVRLEDGADYLKTRVTSEVSAQGKSQSSVQTLLGSLKDTDENAAAASAGMAAELDLTFDDAFQVFRSLSPAKAVAQDQQ